MWSRDDKTRPKAALGSRSPESRDLVKAYRRTSPFVQVFSFDLLSCGNARSVLMRYSPSVQYIPWQWRWMIVAHLGKFIHLSETRICTPTDGLFNSIWNSTNSKMSWVNQFDSETMKQWTAIVRCWGTASKIMMWVQCGQKHACCLRDWQWFRCQHPAHEPTCTERGPFNV